MQYNPSKAVFANEDTGIFSAVPVTLDLETQDLELEVDYGHVYAAAGSLVIEGAKTLGILPERYELRGGRAQARVVWEGYAYAQMLTDKAKAALDVLPKIVLTPYSDGRPPGEPIDHNADEVPLTAMNGIALVTEDGSYLFTNRTE
jgi:hypothetical protein